MSPATIVLAAGGTGGHIFPAEALARVLIGRGHKVALVTDRRGDAFGDASIAVESHTIRSATVGAGVIGKLRTVVALVLGTLQARRLLKRLRPAALVGFGGHASAPTVLAASGMGIPVLLHEQNAVLGRTNRLLAKRADRIATAFPSVERLPAGGADRLARTGNPVRAAIAEQAGAPYAPPADKGPVRILVLGGSQGARALSELIPAALADLPEPLRGRLVVTQQCREEDLPAVRAVYRDRRIVHQLDTFFRDVPRLMAEAHLVICRAGASTIAELTAIGRPAILIPFPFAMDDHQTANARALETAGGGWLMPQEALDPAGLGSRIEALLAAPETLAEAAAKARAFGTSAAADRLADAVLDLAGTVQGNGGGASRRPRQEVAA
ncbi:MAG: undecaprenyldiphospho-muramoylpentapeptide beta-N-acetylglucosaminyltransferase [Inquilinus sp.]|nr:undecaprenyldiphospho-muramoylpentapeptide beta-N-acetylglucosaminyltransferase [Inquilinus sp.]